MSRFNYNILNEIVKDVNTINPRLCLLLLLPLFFMGNNKLIPLIPLISTAYSISIVYKLGLFDNTENKEEEEGEEGQTSDEEEEGQASDEEKEAQASEEEKDSDCLQRNCHLIILAVKNTNHKYILTNTNELISTYKSKLIELGSIKLESTNINLIVLEIDVSEDDIEQLKQDNELYDYTIFDDTLNKLNDVKLECIWRRYKHILKENEYKDNTYTIL